jgi:hypothetical protein
VIQLRWLENAAAPLIQRHQDGTETIIPRFERTLQYRYQEADIFSRRLVWSDWQDVPTVQAEDKP